MADQLYVSYWLRGFTASNQLRHYERLLNAFPYSRLAQSSSVLRVHAVSGREPLILEQPFENPPDVKQIIAACRENANPDCAFELETKWDLWQFDRDWAVQPARASLWCLGPEYEADRGENLRIDFGVDTLFLPTPHLPESLHLIQSNIRSLLKLVHDLDSELAVERRQLWTETGENFADQLQEALAATEPD